jgi:hypothetical protein
MPKQKTVGPYGLRVYETPQGEFFADPLLLIEFVNCSICQICFGEIDDASFEQGHCPHCGNDLLCFEDDALTCSFCRTDNPIPYPLDRDMQCVHCGRSM